MVNNDENDNVIGETSLPCHTANALPTMVPLTQFYWPNTLRELFVKKNGCIKQHCSGDCSSMYNYVKFLTT
jgi:hypothetical protein